jgi:hypothetical protein
VPDCELGIEPEEVSVLPRRDVQFVVSGGTGQARFALTRNDSGALIAERSGSYLSGAVTGGRDQVEVTDPGCPAGSATAVVHVLDPMVVAPLDTTLLPDTVVSIAVHGGSGESTCEVLYAPSGGDLDGCVYTAGGTPAIDKVRITDAVTDQIIDVVFRVDHEAGIAIPGERWSIPVGSPLRLPASGGSGQLELSHEGGVGAVEGGVFWSDVPGSATVRVRDPFTAMQAERTIDVLQARVPDGLIADGELSSTAVVMGPGDLDGDGYDDVLLGNSEASILAWRGGGAWVYAGGPDGLGEEPAWGFANPNRDAWAGRQLAVGDFDADGELDLAVGSFLESRYGTSSGAVDVFDGVSGAFFEMEPSTQIVADPGDVAGHGLAACDFNGDGIDDLAVGSYGDEDRSQPNIAYSQGSVDVYFGSHAGLSTIPDASIYGQMVDEGGAWAGVRNVNYGRKLAAGDVDGDGRCDLLVGSYDRGVVSLTSRGAVFLHLGTDDGLDPDPARVWAVLDGDTNANAGRSLAVGDVDGDGRADVLIGAWRRDAGTTEWGMAALFRGEAMHDPPGTYVDIEDADWFIRADARYDYMGWSVDLSDVDGDGLADVIVGALVDEVSGTGGQGAVRIFSGADVVRRWTRSYDATLARPDGLLGGVSYYDWYGGAAAGVGDIDGDGTGDVAVVALRDDVDAPELGGLYVAAWDGVGSGARRTLPHVPAGHGVGSLATVAWVDPDGDGYPMLAVSGHGQGAGVFANVGDYWVFDSSSAGGLAVDDGGPMVFRAGSGSYDRDGYSLTSAGDMDGDGYEDLAYASYQDSRAANLGTTYANPTECGARNGAGAVFVVRGGRADRLGPEPYAVQWGGLDNDRVEQIEGVGDVDGDGYDDLVMVSTVLDGGRGGFSIMHGGPADSAGTIARCDDASVTHVDASTRLGRSVGRLGDLDGDGCDDFAVGADQDDLGLTNQGSVRIFWGHGGAGCRATAELTTVVSGNAFSSFGHTMDGGQDVDGDGVPDVIVGAPTAAIDGERVGAAYLFSGATLVRLPAQALGDRLPTAADTVVARVGVELDPAILVGSEVGSNYGWATAVLPGAVAVGAPARDFDDSVDVGVVVVHRWRGRQLDPAPSVILVGETDDPGAWYGSELVLGELGGDPVLAIGSQFHDGSGVDVGGVFPWFVR